MAGVAEKARFFLERAVPQLREFEDKGIFTKDEIRNLVKQRTEYEHLVLAPATTPAKFLAYIEWEQSVERLRQKRCQRLKIKHSSNHAGQARVFATFDRAVKRHPASVVLWREYLGYAAKVKATKKWRRVMTSALRMHPTDAQLWVMAGRKAARDGDMDRARGIFMRGCRFCTRDDVVWLEYARCEMEWLAHMATKTGIKSLAVSAAATAAGETDEHGNMMFGEDEDDDEFGDDMIIPDSNEEKPKQNGLVQEALEKLKGSPALDGAIPRAVFDISKKQPFYSPSTAEAFFDMFSTFTDVPAQPAIIAHVVASMVESFPHDPATCSCQVRQPLIGIEQMSPAFPGALRESLARLKMATETTADRDSLEKKTIAWIEPILAEDGLDPAIRTVLDFTRRKLESP